MQIVVLLEGCHNSTWYSGPSLGGHSQQRRPSLIWPQIFATATIMTMNAFNSPCHQRRPRQCAYNFLANRVALLEVTTV